MLTKTAQYPTLFLGTGSKKITVTMSMAPMFTPSSRPHQLSIHSLALPRRSNEPSNNHCMHRSVYRSARNKMQKTKKMSLTSFVLSPSTTRAEFTGERLSVPTDTFLGDDLLEHSKSLVKTDIPRCVCFRV